MTQTPLFDTALDTTQSHVTPLHSSAAARQLRHRRTFCYEVFERDDGLWDIESQMLDVKSYDMTLGGQVRSANTPFHNMRISITLNDEFTIVAVDSGTLAAPYNSECAHINPTYQQMVGMNLLAQFRNSMRATFGKTMGCTHLTELSYNLPTAAIQGMGTILAKRRLTSGGDVSPDKPSPVNQCHALAQNSPTVRDFYPKWYRKDPLSIQNT